MYFADIAGHRSLKNNLIANINQKRISHAQLFAGPEGSGNLLMALAYARYMLCISRDQGDACGTCSSCKKFDKLEHPDVHFYFPTIKSKDDEEADDNKAGSKTYLMPWRELLLESAYFQYGDWLKKLGVENQQAMIYAKDCNEMLNDLRLKAFEGRYKIVIIWMIEKLKANASPKLLKTLEEPSEGVVFLLVSHNKNAIIKTILSRLQLIKVPLLRDEEIEHHLSEKFNLKEPEARRIAFLSEGNYAKALSFINDTDESETDLLAFRDWMRLCFKKNPIEILQWTEKVSKIGRERQIGLLQQGLTVFRLCLLKNYRAAEAIRLEGEQLVFIERFATFVTHRNALEIIDSFNEGIFHIARNASPKILFTDLSFTLSKLLKATK
ncbi:MAG TPA: hypothetical protein VLH61_10415 [Bacteroidales bacterium]|nr:hypothetical protein [Bacteroidales bacterium]